MSKAHQVGGKQEEQMLIARTHSLCSGSSICCYDCELLLDLDTCLLLYLDTCTLPVLLHDTPLLFLVVCLVSCDFASRGPNLALWE